jgi:hypothetical protein
MGLVQLSSDCDSPAFLHCGVPMISPSPAGSGRALRMETARQEALPGRAADGALLLLFQPGGKASALPSLLAPCSIRGAQPLTPVRNARAWRVHDLRRICWRWAPAATPEGWWGRRTTRTEGGAAAAASCLAAVLTEIYLCNVCSCREMLRRHGRRQGAAGVRGDGAAVLGQVLRPGSDAAVRAAADLRVPRRAGDYRGAALLARWAAAGARTHRQPFDICPPSRPRGAHAHSLCTFTVVS